MALYKKSQQLDVPATDFRYHSYVGSRFLLGSRGLKGTGNRNHTVTLDVHSFITVNYAEQKSFFNDFKEEGKYPRNNRTNPFVTKLSCRIGVPLILSLPQLMKLMYLLKYHRIESLMKL